MKRRAFITLLGGAAAAWPFAARAQQAAMPVVGFLRPGSPEANAHLVAAFRKGLGETGYVEGQNVTIEYRWADNQLDRLPGLAAELVRRQVAVIVGNTPAAEVAKTATETIPIIFVTGEDPVTKGLVASLNRPSGNVTGVVFFASGHLGTKRMELLCEMVPKAAIIAVLMDPKFATELPAIEGAGRALGRQILVLNAASERELDAAFSQMVQAGAGAVLVGGSPFFTSQSQRLVGLAARHAIPAIYDARDHVEAGGLMSYGAVLREAYYKGGIYAGQVLRGVDPADLPVEQINKFELVINLKTAKALGLDLSPALLATADEVIE